MARPPSRLRMGFFPLPEAEARRIRQHLIFPASNFTALDPCAGEGKALAVITDGGPCQRCGIELDAYRAEEAKQRLDQVIYGDCFDVECKAESCSCMIVNPPYDTVPSDEGGGQRVESLFLQHTYRWLKPGGVLILVIPVAQLAVCGNIMSLQFKDVEVYRLSEPECVQYKQILVFAVRRTRRERERLQEREISWSRLEYGRKSRSSMRFQFLRINRNASVPYLRVSPSNSFTVACRSMKSRTCFRSVPPTVKRGVFCLHRKHERKVDR